MGNSTVILQGKNNDQGKPNTTIEGNVFGGAKSGNVDGSTNVIIVPTDPGGGSGGGDNP